MPDHSTHVHQVAETSLGPEVQVGDLSIRKRRSARSGRGVRAARWNFSRSRAGVCITCLLYTSDAADE